MLTVNLDSPILMGVGIKPWKHNRQRSGCDGSLIAVQMFSATVQVDHRGCKAGVAQQSTDRQQIDTRFEDAADGATSADGATQLFETAADGAISVGT